MAGNKADILKSAANDACQEQLFREYGLEDE